MREAKWTLESTDRDLNLLNWKCGQKNALDYAQSIKEKSIIHPDINYWLNK